MPSEKMLVESTVPWDTVSLDNVCSLVSRGTAPVYVEHSSVKAIGQRCVAKEGFQPRLARFHDSRALSGCLEAEAGDVLLNSTGTGTIGRSCVFPGGDRYIVDGHVTVLRSGPSLDARWLEASLRHPSGQRHLEVHCYSGSTNQVELSRRELAESFICLPPLPEQKLIASVLDTVDEVIRKTEEVIAKLQQMKQGLLHDLLTRGIDDNGELRDPDRHPEQFKDSPLGRIPKDWEAPELAVGIAFITDYRGITPPYSDEGIQVISAENVGNGRIKSITKYVTEEVFRRTSTRGFAEPGDTIFTTEAPVAEVAQVPDHTCRLTRRVIALRPKPDYWDKDFLFWFVFHSARAGAWDAFTHGSTVPRILKPDILARPIARPTIAEQRRIVAVLNARGLQSEAEELELSKLRLLKAGLMDDLLTGRVRVTHLLEEPATP